MCRDPTPAATIRRPASPFRLNLEQQRKRAKELLKGLRAGDADSVARFLRHHPRSENGDVPPDLQQLSEAQLVIARELGLPSWPRLKEHIEAFDKSWRSIAGGDAAPDRDIPTLHIRCGEDIAATLRDAGFVGDFLEYSDPFCQGPVFDAPDWLARRAAFLAEAYGAGTGKSLQQIAGKLSLAEDRLRLAATRYERVVLWFEHDSYDQLILSRCLARFEDAPPPRLELISPGAYPGGVRFIGLGQLPPEALRLLWEERTAVSQAVLREGQAVWAMLRASDPQQLAETAKAGTPALPQLGRAVQRHCQEFPATRNGLGLTEHLILEILAEQPRTIGEMYSKLMLEREPLPWLADLMIRFIVESMKRVTEPVFTGTFGSGDRHWPKETLTITPLGRAVLAGEIDFLTLRPPPRWLGGVLIPSAGPCWRWDEKSETMLHC